MTTRRWAGRLGSERVGSCGQGAATAEVDAQEARRHGASVGLEVLGLGVIGNFEKAMKERFEVQGKPERTPRVVAIVESIVAAGRAAPGEVETLRVAWRTHVQCFGRCGAVALHHLSRLAAGPAQLVDDGTEFQLSFWPKYLQEAKPMMVKLNGKRPPVLVFVDEAEVDSVSDSAVMFDPCDEVRDRQFVVYDMPTANDFEEADAGVPTGGGLNRGGLSGEVDRETRHL